MGLQCGEVGVGLPFRGGVVQLERAGVEKLVEQIAGGLYQDVALRMMGNRQFLKRQLLVFDIEQGVNIFLHI